MKKDKYIDLLITDNITSGDKQELYSGVIYCAEIALSQSPVDFEIDSSIGLEELFGIIEASARKNSKKCVGPFEAAELIAERLGATYIRASKPVENKINLEDFL
ncbi:MAG: hypothetical protein FWE36_05175 [Erysipelotrichales bacterium]|nr:hypothetical protein [Erysipelotrichales bacterium]